MSTWRQTKPKKVTLSGRKGGLKVVALLKKRSFERELFQILICFVWGTHKIV